MIIKDQTSYYPPYITRLEQNFSKLTSRNYSLTFSNGTSALEAAIFSLSTYFGNRKVILVPSMTFHSDLDAIINLGFQIRFIDVQKNNIVPSVDEIERQIDDDVACVILCHLFGFHLDILNISRLLDSKNIFLIEDCSHVHCKVNSSSDPGKLSSISFYSLQGAKAVAAGEGGICVTDDKELFIRMSAYSHFGRHDQFFEGKLQRYLGVGVGHKHRMHPLGAPLALTDLQFLAYQNSVIEKNAKFFILALEQNANLNYPARSSIASARFAGFPVLVRSASILNVVSNILNEYKIIHQFYPFKTHHQMERYTDGVEAILLNTEDVASRLILINRRYLEFLPQYHKYLIRKAFEKIGGIQ